MGGAGITLAMVESSSGAAAAAATKPAMVSGVAGRHSMPPVKAGMSWSWYLKRTATPKLPPPPRMAQNRSGSCVASTVWSLPSAVTISAASSESMVRPHLRER